MPAGLTAAYYVYAVARSRSERTDRPSSIGSGHPPVYALPYRDLVAIVRPVSAEEFDPGALEAHLQDTAWVGRTVLAHHEVLVGLLGRYTLAPVKFCALYRSQESVRELLSRHYQDFADTLACLEGATEWGGKVYCDRQVVVERTWATGQGLEPLREEIARASAGVAYFLRKKLEQAAQEEAERVTAACRRESHERLAACSRAAVANPVQPPEVHGRGMAMILNGAYLVDGASLDALRAVVASLDERYAPVGFYYELTGPWPPYSFVNWPAKTSHERTDP